jgi:hypothetical protein
MISLSNLAENVNVPNADIPSQRQQSQYSKSRRLSVTIVSGISILVEQVENEGFRSSAKGGEHLAGARNDLKDKRGGPFWSRASSVLVRSSHTQRYVAYRLISGVSASS